MTEALKHHWPEYLIEAVCLGLFMISAFSFVAIVGAYITMLAFFLGVFR